MKRLSKKFIFFLLAFFFLLFFPVQILAQTSSSESLKTVTLNKDQVVNQDYFTAGERVIIDGTVNGDAYVAGGQVDVNGTVNGDLLVLGGQVNIRGTISQNIRAIGGNIVITGKTGKNVSIAGGNLTIDNTAKVGGNIVVAGGNVGILTQVNNLTVAGGMIRLGGNVLGNVTAGVGTLDILPEVTIKGNLNYWSDNEATISQSAKITGQTSFHQTQLKTNLQKTSEKNAGTIFGASIFFLAISFISLLVLGILFLRLLPVYTQKMAEVVKNKFWVCFGTGLIALIIAPVLVVLLMITLVGFPIALALIFVYGIVLYVAKLFVILVLGKYVGEKAKWNLTPIWTFTVGLLIYYFLGFIPVVGWLTKTIFTLVGVGAIILQKKYYYSMLREKELI
jgi:hypothetical protein